MPIRESEKSRYAPPKEWRAIRARILERAKLRCEFCGVRQYGVGHWQGDGFCYVRGNAFWDQFQYTGSYAEAREACDELNECGYDEVRRIVIVLTIAHLDHTPENNSPENLRALCQRCHLRYDAKHHAGNARETRRMKRNKKQPNLFDQGAAIPPATVAI